MSSFTLEQLSNEPTDSDGQCAEENDFHANICVEDIIFNAIAHNVMRFVSFSI